MHAVVPLKPYAYAKQRLACVLGPRDRSGLMRAMVTDVLHALAGVKGLDGVLLVSREPDAPRLAAATGADLFAEPHDADLSEAVQAAGGFLMARHEAPGTLIVPGDIPLVTAADLAAVLDRHCQLTLVPDTDGDGTNCIVSSPPNLIRYQFDGHSFRPHLDAAYAIGITPRICRPLSIGLDIDTPADLARLVASLHRTDAAVATRSFLEDSGLTERLDRMWGAARQSG